MDTKISAYNNFHLKRRYVKQDLVSILQHLYRITSDWNQKRFVSFGAEDGYILVEAHKLWGKDMLYIGIEGGHRVGNGKENELIENAQHMFAQHGMDVHGMQKETLFETAISEKHESTMPTNIPTIAHFYDGGIVPKEVMLKLYSLIDKFAGKSIMVFVTSQEKNIDKDDVYADWKHICYHMKNKLGWKLPFEKNIFEEYADESTMIALFFQKK